MNEHPAFFEDRFVDNLKRHGSLRKRIQQKVDRVRKDPYSGIERLRNPPHGLDLRGYRSLRVCRNFRVIFVICEEYRQVKGRQFSSCEGKEDETVIFVTVGRHNDAYALI
jgi:mRNA-degrading endonuclease RelE of RelBE toxin-antitoxin system